jgi:hypothetical protein
MKFLLDMGISPKTAGFLQELGYKAVHLQEEGLDRLSDSQIQEKALRIFIQQLEREEQNAKDLEIIIKRADYLNQEAAEVLTYQVPL